MKTQTRLTVFRKEKGWTLQELGDQLGVSAQAACRYCLPIWKPHHRRPNAAVAEKLKEISAGEITVANYSDVVVPA